MGEKCFSLLVSPYLSVRGPNPKGVSSWIRNDLQLCDLQETSVGSHLN